MLVLVDVTRLTRTNFIGLFPTLQGKYGFTKHAWCLWHTGYAESSQELLSRSTSCKRFFETPSGGDAKVAHPGIGETGHKWTTWDVKWENYIHSMVGVLGIPLYYVTCCVMPAGWTAANKHNHLIYQVIQIGPAW